MRKTCALTGHRELSPDFDKNTLYDRLEEMIHSGCDRFLCGMAAGFDLAALECLVDLREKYRITLVACVPYLGQERGFPEPEKERYRRLMGMCDEKVILAGRYEAGCLLLRNRYMADRADVVLAYCERGHGGTAYTVRYAQQHGVPVEFVKFHQKKKD